MGEKRVLTEKEIRVKVISELIRNFIFLAIAVLIAQPIFYVILAKMFAGKMKYYRYNEQTTFLPKFTYYIHPIIKITAIVLLLLLVTYCVLMRSSTKQYRFKPVKALALNNLTIVFFMLTFAWITFAFCFSEDYLFSFWDVIDYKRGYVYFICYAVIVMAILCCTKKQKFTFLEVLIFVGFIINLLAEIKYCFGVNFRTYEVEDAAIFSNRNHYGYFLSIITILSAVRLYLTKNKYLEVYYALNLIISEFALLISQTRGSFVGVVISIVLMLVYFGIKRKFNWKLIIVPAIMIVTFLTLEISGVTMFMDRLGLLASDIATTANSSSHTEEEVEAAGSGRIAIWKQVIEQIKTSPIVGVGIGRTTMEHNEFLQIAAWSGIPAALLYVCALFFMVIDLFKKKTKLTDTQLVATFAVISYATQSFFGGAMLQTVPFYIIVLALSLNIKVDKKTEIEEVSTNSGNQQKQ